MGFWNRLVAPAAPRDGKQLDKALEKACYRHIRLHLQQLKDEPDLGRSLELMAPGHFGEMARQSCRAVADVVVATVHELRRQTESCAGGQSLPEISIAREEVMPALVPRLSGFGQALDRYSGEYERITRSVAQATGGLAGRSFEAGYRGAAIGDGLFGPLGAVVVAMAGGWWEGKSTERAIQAEAERLDQAFNAMLGAWDAGMASLRDAALNGLKEVANRL